MTNTAVTYDEYSHADAAVWTSTRSDGGTPGTASPPLALAALAVLAICAGNAATSAADDAADPGLIKLTVNEVRRLSNTFIIRPTSDLTHRLHWSRFRRRHQARARRSHYTRRLNLELQH
jgi:hypothetical protein